ncbi:P-loop containing nucleoside triphosphate hydrolase protein [Paraphoma chrysanthemicola]|uniref:P-loop containing nucleoside triphosphate hydrolase protein n=1 Tax=Paraphoma chrysanthemicola TaxID=798071 RepID=A0A8K0QXJ7_9PLEO|nr:P-loop containing nucleoside triphosphate hydrolase protein [Paraphoma chrysanthemicola]
MSPSPASESTDDQEKSIVQATEEKNYILQAGWKALFGFTTKKHLPIFSGALLCAVVAAASLPVFAVMYGLIFQKYTDFGSGKIGSAVYRSDVTRYCLILTGVAALNWLANSVYFSFFITFGEIQARSARNRIFDALITKDMAWYDTRETGTVAFLPTVQMHIRDLQLSVSAPFGEGTQCIVEGLAALGVAFYYSWNLTLVILCTVPLIYLVQSFVAHRLSIRANEQADKLQLALKYVANAIQSIELIKCLNGEQYEIQAFARIAALAGNLYNRVANLRSTQIGVMQFFTLSVFVQGFFYGGYLINSGKKDIGQVVTTFWAALMAIQGITGFLPQFIVLQKGRVAGARLQLLMNRVSASDQHHDSRGSMRPVRCFGDIEFRKVTFSYPTRADEIAIRDVSLFFPAGETTFVIGKSGSGKSTLGQLLVRFYQPSLGQILLDNLALNDIDVQWLRQNVTLVEQHSVLFNETVRGNIALGKPGEAISLQDFRDAIQFAMLDTILQDLPDGLETELGNKGSSLSGGQRQRLALARARVRDTPVLILDESTSALDYVTRAAILQAIRQWRKGKTTIVITHDISQIQSEDFLYLMENAQVVQEGYRKELEASPGAFLAMFSSDEDDELDESDADSDSSSVYSQEEDEIIAMYDESSWNLHGPVHRPMSAVMFGGNVLSPFLSKGHDSVARGIIGGYEKRFSRLAHDGVAVTGDTELTPVRSDQGAVKLPPGMLQAAQVCSHQRQRYDRPPSQASHHKRMSGVYSCNRPLSMSYAYGARPTSVVSSMPGMRTHSANAYPRRLSIANRESVHSMRPEQLSKRQQLRRSLGLTRVKDVQQGTSDDTLSIMTIFKSVWPVLSTSSRLLLICAILSAAVHAAAIPTFAWVFNQLLTTLYLPGSNLRRSLTWSMAILGISIGNGLASYLLFYLADRVAQSWVHALKVEALRRILLQPREFFDKEENSLSRLAETLDHFAEEARNLPGRFAGVFIVIGFMVIISLTWSLITAWKLSLVAIAAAPVLFVITKAYNMISSHWERLANEADDAVGTVLHETFVNIRTVRCLNLEPHFRAKYVQATTAALNVGIKRALYSGSIFGLNIAAPLFVAILLFWYGMVLVSTGQYSVGQITETFLVLMLTINHVNYITNYITQVNISRQAGSRLLRLARLPTDSHELTGTVRVQEAGDVVFNKVNFAYSMRKDVQVLKDVSFTIKKGSCTAIVGTSGSGKSTIASLLLKLYQPSTIITATHPALTVSNYDIKAVNTTSLRSRLAIVSQTPVIFPGTIAENISYALSPSSPLASLESIRAAAEAAGVAEFIDSLPNGYQTLVGEGGTILSGGQAQRLAIARALVRDPDILILDEATSALDVVSASIIRDTVRRLVRSDEAVPGSPASPPLSPRSRLGGVWDGEEWENAYGKEVGRGVDSGYSAWKGKEVRKQMTVIIITHAREMMAIAEHVVMLDKGRVVEQGSFSELKRRKGGAFGRLLRGEREV